MKHTWLTLAALAGALAVAGPARAEVWSRSYEVTGRPTVRIVTDDFRVRVHSRASGPVEFRVEYQLHKFGLVTLRPREPQLQFEQSGDVISLTAHAPSVMAFFATVDQRAVIEVTVPVGSDVSVRTTDGSVECEPLSGKTEIETHDGRIRATGLEGTAWLRTGDGSIEGFDLRGRLTARTSDGHIRVEGRFDVLDVSSGDGRVKAVARPGSQIADAWNLETRDGSLSLDIPRDLRAFLDARTGDGSLNVELPIATGTRARRHELAGQLNGGGGPLRLRTGDGSLTLALAN